jgi:dihydrofolate reductase
LQNPTGNKASDEFAVMIDKIPKIVFSRTLTSVDWQSATLATKELTKEVEELKQQEGKDIFVGSPGLIDALTQKGLIDEYQLCVHPVILGKGLPLFKTANDRMVLKLLKTKTFGSGAIVLYYESGRRQEG